MEAEVSGPESVPRSPQEAEHESASLRFYARGLVIIRQLSALTAVQWVRVITGARHRSSEQPGPLSRLWTESCLLSWE